MLVYIWYVIRLANYMIVELRPYALDHHHLILMLLAESIDSVRQ